MRWVKWRRFIVLFKYKWISQFKKMSVWSLTYKQSACKHYHSNKHLSEFSPTRWRQEKNNWPSYETKLRHCHTLWFHRPYTLLDKSSAVVDGASDASCQLKSCQLPRNSAETTCTTSPEQIEVMKLEGYGGPMCNKHVRSTMTRSSGFHCLIGVINKPTTVELCISPVYRRLAVAKFLKSTM